MPVLPLPSHGILSFDCFEFSGPNPKMDPLPETEFRQWIEDLHLRSIVGVLPTTVLARSKTLSSSPVVSDRNPTKVLENANTNTGASVLHHDPSKPIPSRFAKPSEIMMAIKIASCVRARLARRKVEGMRSNSEFAGIVSSVLGSATGNNCSDGNMPYQRYEKAAISVQRFYRARQARIRAQERREGRLMAPRPRFPPSTPEIPILSKRERRRNFLWPLVPSLRRHKPNHADFWKWCDKRGHNVRVCNYNDPNSREVALWNKHFYLDAQGRSRLSNKINFILERVSAICLTCVNSHSHHKLRLES